jgi:hypothetical protein
MYLFPVWVFWLPVYFATSEITAFSLCSLIMMLWMFHSLVPRGSISGPTLTAESVLKGKQALILYLRSFNDDLTDRVGPYLSANANEIVLVSAFEDIGCVITIANPLDRNTVSHHKAADRIHLTTREWQVRVEQLISASQFVIIQADISQNLEWEISACRRHLDPRQLLVSFLPLLKQDQATKERIYQRFKRHAEPLMGCTLPSEVGNAFFAQFEQDWTAKLVKVSNWRNLHAEKIFTVAVRARLRSTLKDSLGFDPGWSKTICLLLKASLLPSVLGFSFFVFLQSPMRCIVDLCGLALAAFTFINLLSEQQRLLSYPEQVGHAVAVQRNRLAPFAIQRIDTAAVDHGVPIDFASLTLNSWHTVKLSHEFWNVVPATQIQSMVLMLDGPLDAQESKQTALLQSISATITFSGFIYNSSTPSSSLTVAPI